MGSAQCEACFIGMFEGCGLPSCGGVAALAGCTVVTLVNVVFRMARKTVVALCRRHRQAGRMASDASKPRVPGGQCKTGLELMIKLALLPIVGAMTLLAVATQSAVVDIVLLMTACTLGRGVGEIAGVMTIGACGNGV